MSPAEVTEKLGLHRMRDRSWFVHPSCATSGEVSARLQAVLGRILTDDVHILTNTGLIRRTQLALSQRQEATGLRWRE